MDVAKIFGNQQVESRITRGAKLFANLGCFGIVKIKYVFFEKRKKSAGGGQVVGQYWVLSQKCCLRRDLVVPRGIRTSKSLF